MRARLHAIVRPSLFQAPFAADLFRGAQPSPCRQAGPRAVRDRMDATDSGGKSALPRPERRMAEAGTSANRSPPAPGKSFRTGIVSGPWRAKPYETEREEQPGADAAEGTRSQTWSESCPAKWAWCEAYGSVQDMWRGNNR